MAITITVNGVDKTAFLRFESVRGNRLVGARGTMSCQFVDKKSDNTAYRPTLDQTVVLKDGVNTIFTGKITDVEDSAVDDKAIGTITQVTVTNDARFLDQILITKAYAVSTTLKALLQDLIANYFTSYGVTLDASQAVGATLAAQNFENATGTEILNHLTEVTGWVWRLTDANVLRMFAPGVITAATNFDTTNVMHMTWTKSRRDYANKVTVIYGQDGQQINHTTTFTGDGATRVFPLKYVGAPNIIQNLSTGVWSPLGVNGVDTSLEWTYRASDNSVVQLAVAPLGTPHSPLAVGVQIVAHQEPTIYPQTASVSDAAEIASYGSVRERRFTDATITDYDAAVEYATGLLNRTKSSPTTIELISKPGAAPTGVSPAESTTLTFANRTITGLHLIIEVEFSSDGKGRLIWQVSCLSGSQVSSTWLDYFRNLGGGSSGGVASGGTGGGSSSGSWGSGTPDTLAKWSSATVLTDSIVSEGDLGITIGGPSNLFVTTVTAATITTPAATDLTLDPTGLIVTAAALKPDTNFAQDIGTLTSKYRSIYAGELVVETLVAQDVVSTIGGRILVAPTTELIADAGTADTTIDVKHNNLASGDRVYLASNLKLEWMAITSAPSTIAGGFRYSVTRNIDGYQGIVTGVGGLIGYWRLNETVGTSAADTSGAAHTGTYAGGVTLGVTGPLADPTNFAATFDGVDDKVTIGGGNVTIGATFSIEAWIKTTTALGVPVFSNRTSNAASDSSVYFGLSGGKVLAFVNGVANLLSNALVNTGAWVHVVWTCSGGTVSNIYINGVLDSAFGHIAKGSFGGPGFIAWDAGNATQWFPGSIDEVAIYGSALSASQIQEHYTARLATGTNPWIKGDAVVNTGTTGDGFIDLYAVQSVFATAGPTVIGNVRTGTRFSDVEPRWAIGNLNGVYGYGSDIYGVALGSPTGAWVKIDPTNGVRIGHNVTNKVVIDAAGNASFTGAITATSGSFTGAITATSGSLGTLSVSGNITIVSGGLFWNTGQITNGGVSVTVGPNSRSNDHGYVFTGTNGSFFGLYANTVWAASGSLELVNFFDTAPNPQNQNAMIRIHVRTPDAGIGSEAFIMVEAIDSANTGRLWFYAGTGEYFYANPVSTASATTARWTNTGAATGFVRTPWFALQQPSSDERLKADIRPLELGMDALRQITPIRFEIRANGERTIGFSAQNLNPVMPEAAPPNTDGYLGFREIPVLALAVAAIKELDARLTALGG
jgi:hypothetical protein